MFIAEKGLDIETIEVDIRAGEQFSDAFRAINPLCTVPVLTLDNGQHLTTTDGCRAWLEATYPNPPLLGRTAEEKGQIADLLHIIMFNGQQAISEALRNSMDAMADRGIVGPDNYVQIPELAERGRARGARFLDRLEAMIGDQEFIAGDIFTAADIDAFIYVTFAKWAEIEPGPSHTNIRRWYDAAAARPSAAL
jgi:glutathione S-transferase